MARPARRSILALGALLPALGLARGAAARRPLKWAHVYETSEPFHRAAVWASDQLRERSGGAIDIQVFPASSLGKESDLNQGLRLGSIELVTGGVAFPARRYPRLGIAYYPYLFRDASHLLTYSRSDVFAEIAEGFRAQTGVALVSYAYYGTRHVSARRPFVDCAGMAGLKIRVPDVAAYSITPRACAANPTPIAFAELYLALQNQTVDAQENPLTTIFAKRLFEVQQHIMLTGHVVDGLTTMVAPHVWGRLGLGERALLTEVAQQAAARASDEIRVREAELVSEFRQRGLGVHEVDRESFRRAVLNMTDVGSLGYEQRDYDRITAIGA